MILRPHHLLCLFAYRGVAESSAMGLRMEKLRQRYMDGERVSLRAGHDTICARCPHMEPGTTCGSAQGTTTSDELDRRIASALSMPPGITTTAGRVAAAVHTLDDAALAALCEGCSWRDHMGCTAGIRSAANGLLASAGHRQT